MEVGGYRLRERKEKPVRLLPLYWYQLPDDVLQQLYKYVPQKRYALRSTKKLHTTNE
jgi:hypothetical protein|eukprot:COSAG02_NODE_8819_length_2432_cov_314.948564_1_plen_57_part_00